jgi:hypothetical protein
MHLPLKAATSKESRVERLWQQHCFGGIIGAVILLEAIMRTLHGRSVFLLLLLLPGIALAQNEDTNFARGPQYLLTNGSPLFARPIATPTMSLPPPATQIGAADSTAGLAAGAEDATVVPQPPKPFDFFPIYYGRKWVNEVRMSATPENFEVPASLLGEGVTQMTTAQWGYGLSLAKAAAEGKARGRRAGHVYTNEDIDRLRKSS